MNTNADTRIINVTLKKSTEFDKGSGASKSHVEMGKIVYSPKGTKKRECLWSALLGYDFLSEVSFGATESNSLAQISKDSKFEDCIVTADIKTKFNRFSFKILFDNLFDFLRNNKAEKRLRLKISEEDYKLFFA